MAKTIQLEQSILKALKTPAADQWLTITTRADLGNLIHEAGRSAAPSSIPELIDAIFYLTEQGLLSVRQRDHGTGPVPLDHRRADDEIYKGAFFGQGAFELKLTHKGRRMLDQSPEERADTDQFDDKIPTLYRAKYFEPDLEKAIEEARDRDEQLSLLMLDLDHFKKVNDSHGHLIGDEVLRGCGDLVARRARGKGRAYRFGGEEFTVVLPNFGLSEAITGGEQMRKAIETATVSSKNLIITASVGVACFPDHATLPTELIKRADEAMYRAKALGRNLLRVSGEPEGTQSVPRETQRRQPPAGALSDEEVQGIRRTYFQGLRPECPRDGAVLEIRRFDTIGSRTPTILVSCPLCGLSQMSKGPS